MGCAVTDKTKEERADMILDLFGVRFRKNKAWSKPRCNTEWGTKTRQGAIACIVRIMFGEDAPHDALFRIGGEK